MTDQPKPQTLDFDTERGASRSKWVAWALVIAITGWMGSGYIYPTQTSDDDTSQDTVEKVTAVAVSLSKAETVTRNFVAEGQALPDRSTDLRAEATGQIKEVLVVKGDMVAAGDVIARFDVAQNEADLNRAQQELARAQREFDNAETLVDRGVATNDRLVQARSSLASAQAAVTAAQKALDYSEITAPFGGRIEALDLNAGEFVSAGSSVGQVVDNTPLTVTIQVPQQSLRDIKAGQTADVTFITGEELQGTVAFVGSNANSETRTFLAEITVENADGVVPAGVSAEIRIPIGEITAHFLSPAILSLDTDGTLGIKTVDADNTVVFAQVKIERAQTDGIWVSGLPDTANIITIGQGYVTNGDKVNPQSQTELAEASQ
uniref:efflux RND transporter periplasmic adaptor subunit n=1 Tax=Yoonia sp. TaxID=2212373 RepID=UPI0040482C4C